MKTHELRARFLLVKEFERREEYQDQSDWACAIRALVGVLNPDNLSDEVGDAGSCGMVKCRHENGSASYDMWHCRDCGAVKTDSGWGAASHRYFNNRADAEFYRKNGRLPDNSGDQPWGN